MPQPEECSSTLFSSHTYSYENESTNRSGLLLREPLDVQARELAI